MGLSQPQLAGLASCSVAFVGNLERGYIPNRSDVLPRILAVLDNGVDPAGNRVDVHNGERSSAHAAE